MKTALEVLPAQPARFDVVVLDVMLPGKDGFAVIAEMRQAGQFIPTLMLTARGHPKTCCTGLRPAPTTTSPSRSNWLF